jgi:hypothetical protein
LPALLEAMTNFFNSDDPQAVIPAKAGIQLIQKIPAWQEQNQKQ